MRKLILLFCSFLISLCQPASLVAKDIFIDEFFNFSPIGKYIHIYEDYSQTLTINDLLTDTTLSYISQNHDELVYGARRIANIWIKIPIKNISNIEQSLQLRTKDTYLRFMWAYITDGKTVSKEYLGGLQTTFYQRTIPHRNTVFPIIIPPNERKVVFLKIDGRWDSMQFPIELYSSKEFISTAQTENMFYGIFFGFLAMVSILALISFIIAKIPLLGWYALYTASNLLNYISISGFDFQYLVPNYPLVAHHDKLATSLITFLLFFPMFLSYFQEEKEGIRIAKKVFPFMICCLGALLLLVIFQDFINIYANKENFKYNFYPVLILGLFACFILFTIIRIVYLNPIWQNVLFLVGYSLIILEVIFAVFVNNGVVKLPFSYANLNIMATSLELSCLAVLFFEKLLTLRKEKQMLDSEVKIARIEKEKAEKIRELDQAKTRLYTNITHEFRTPLTVIKGMTAQIEGNDNKKELIQRNSDTLLRLINQMLDLSKADKGELPYQPIQNDVIQYIRYLSESFRSWGAVKNIRLHFLPEIEECWMDYDPDKIQDVLSNLLSNAIKNTDKGGDVYIILKKKDKQLIINIKDTGKGIEKKYLPRLFDRFYQVDETDTRSDVGSGIGLALCKELVQIMDGQISVKSEVGVGSEFEVQLPITQKAAIQKGEKSYKEIANLEPLFKKQSMKELAGNSKIHPNGNKEQATVLIVEDNSDVRHYLRLCLEKEYQLLIAENGKIGIQEAIEKIPDLILSDIMMPDTNGLELCNALKTNVLTSHIPIILLTAKADQAAKIQGLSKGADAYLTKPFQKDELTVRIQSLIDQRARMQEHFLKNTNASKNKKFAAENKFLTNLKKLVHTHLSDETFDVQRLSFELKMSRSQVYRKVKALTGRSIASYIRYLRLQEGKKLLETTELSISEVAYEVGFNDLSYFSNSFSAEFGYPPNATRK